MSAETKEQLREKIEEFRRLQPQMTDRGGTESLRTHIEELEARLLLEMGRPSA